MSAPPITTRFYPEDYGAAVPEWFQRFVTELNVSYEQLTGAIDGGIVRGANLDGGAYSVRLETEAAITADAKPFPILLKPQQRAPPRHLWCTRVEVLTPGATLPVSAVQPIWELASDGRLRIRYVTGLDVSTAYRLSFLSE